MKGYETWTQADVERRNRTIAGQNITVSEPPVQSKPSKYRNVRTEVDGHKFDSLAESQYWLLLKARVKAGEITGLERQKRFPLYCPDRQSNFSGVQHVVCEFVADFVWIENGNYIVADVKGGKTKGTRTRLYALKVKWMALQNGIDVREVGIL